VNEVRSITVSPGLKVGEYVLDEKIGQGAFGEVWSAHHRAWTDQKAAAKIPTDSVFLRQLQSEGFSLSRLNHPNIVKVVGFDPTASPPYLLTELVDGPSLRQLISAGKLTIADASAIMRQILLGLAYAHKQGAVHGDLKPENVLTMSTAAMEGFRSQGSVKLADFGVGVLAVAALLGNGGSSRLMGSDRIAPIGTVAYIAPEQREGGAPDPRGDLFACGVILFELLTGERPAGAESPGDLNPQVPRHFDDLFRRAYARRDRRFTSAEEFIAALDGVELAPAAPRPPARPAPEEKDDLIALRADDEPERPSRQEPGPPIPVAPPKSRRLPPVARQPEEQPVSQRIDLEPVEREPPFREPVVRETIEPEPIAPEPASVRHAAPVRQQHRTVVIDELARRPLRSADDLRALFQRANLSRTLDEGEVLNLRLRLDTWAESIGGVPDFGQKLQITEALECPYYRVSVTTHFEPGERGESEPLEGAVVLANPAAAQDCGRKLVPDDFVPLVHISTGAILPGLLETISAPVIRMATHNLVQSAKTQAGGRRIARQELKLARATVLSLRWLAETQEGQAPGEQSACFAGSGLQVVAPTAPVIRMRDEVLRRAATLLDSNDIGAGIAELRQMFYASSAVQPRAEQMLVALRSKLASAYMSLADASLGNLGVFESLTYSDKASEFMPGKDDASAHVGRVYKGAYWIQIGPGLTIGLVFGLIAAFTRPFFYGYVGASIAAIVAGLLCWTTLKLRPARTDIAFCHACLLPLALSAILAMGPKSLHQYGGDVAVLIMLGIVLVIDRMVFDKYGYWLLRPASPLPLAGAPLDILNQIQTMLEADWEKLRDHYLQLPPLYKHASAKLSGAAGDKPGDIDELGLPEEP
jgi:serine/threonine-protein kinase